MPSFDADGDQFSGLDEFPDATPSRADADTKVVAKIFLSAHTKCDGGDSHEGALRVFGCGVGIASTRAGMTRCGRS